MAKFDRRKFIAGMGLTFGSATVGLGETPRHSSPSGSSGIDSTAVPAAISVDFRYAPGEWQTVFCFPDDPYKSLVGRCGELCYGHPGNYKKELEYFRDRVYFQLAGMGVPRLVSQSLEAPGVPIVHTRLDQGHAIMELTTFATNEADEGRVDNVLIEVRPNSPSEVLERLVLHIETVRTLTAQEIGRNRLFHLDSDTGLLFMASDSEPFAYKSSNPEDTGHGYVFFRDTGHGYLFRFPHQLVTQEKPGRYFLRFPQEGQPFEKIKDGLSQTNQLLAKVRSYWHQWNPFHGEVTWDIPSPYQEFLVACNRNLLQCRDHRNNFLVFLVGPTIYRDFAIVDLNFILEAARYIGYDREAQESLDASWAAQTKEGGVFANAGPQHWKDTGIAAFTIVRQAELSQNWSYFRDMQPKIVQAFAFLDRLRDKARSEGSANGRYGLLPRGYGDGGLGGIRSEFTNTLWVLAGLKAVIDAADHQGVTGYDAAKKLHAELHQSFLAAAQQEMRQHHDGFQYLPMLMKEDPQWSEAEEWKRPRPQIAQWALSNAIYPGLVFDKNDPIVKGHIALMRSCTQEEIPAETGYMAHEGLWPYNGALVAQVYLWAGLPDLANQVFHGFLNHASPLYCWREEQPLQDSTTAHYIGDMPHNWASAEVIRYLRHMLALEDGSSLRLLQGIRAPQMTPGQPWRIGGTPTKFGRLNLALEPIHGGWQLTFERGPGSDPAQVRVPASLGENYRFANISAGSYQSNGEEILISPEVRKWTATWKIQS